MTEQELAGLKAWLESSTFDAVAYAYRTWPTTDQVGVSQAFEALKQAIARAAALVAAGAQKAMCLTGMDASAPIIMLEDVPDESLWCETCRSWRASGLVDCGRDECPHRRMIAMEEEIEKHLRIVDPQSRDGRKLITASAAMRPETQGDPPPPDKLTKAVRRLLRDIAAVRGSHQDHQRRAQALLDRLVAAGAQEKP